MFRLRRALPAPAFVRLEEANASLLLNERPIRPWNASVFGQGIKNAEGGFGVLARAVGLLERDAEALRDFGEGTRTLLGLYFASPNERVDPRDLAP
jgi:hypothetical protein